MRLVREILLENFDPELHSPMLLEWLHRPHVARWWGDPRRAFESSLQHPSESNAVITADGSPVGYMCWQALPRDEVESAGLTGLPEDLVDIDILIGDPEIIDHGVGAKALRLLLARLRSDRISSVAGVGTAVSNERAIRAFENAGFRLFQEFQDPEFGACWYMLVEIRGAV